MTTPYNEIPELCRIDFYQHQYRCTKCGRIFDEDEIVEIEPEAEDEYIDFVSPCCLAEYDEV